MRGPITDPGSAAWRRTLPRIPKLDPLAGVIGMRLACDAANSAPSGTTLAMTSPGGGARLAGGRPASQFVPPRAAVEALAGLLGLEAADVEARTLREPLARLYGDESVTARAMGPEQPFAVCPECAASRAIALEWAFPFVGACERHGLALVRECACGRRLRPFSGGRPFHCACGRAWAELPRRLLADRERLAQSRLLHTYRVFLAYPDATFVPAARAAVALASPPSWMGGFLATDHPLMDANDAAMVSSLGSFARAFVDLGIPPERIGEVLVMPEPRRGTCQNRSCPLFESDTQIRHNGVRRGEPESYCLECGSRFLGRRIVMSFTDGHGDTRLAPRSVRRAQERLERWRAELARVVDAALGAGTAMTPGQAMAAAGIPASANLRARELGLAAEAARLSGGGDPVPARAGRRRDASMLPWRSTLRPGQVGALIQRGGLPGVGPAAPAARRGRNSRRTPRG